MLNRFFKLDKHKTNVKTELIAGITTFLTMMYIIPVGGAILASTGMPKDSIITSIALISALSTLVTGLYANAPVAMSVGMGLVSYFAYGLVGDMGLSYFEALGAVFASGVIFLIISLTKLRVFIMQSIPKDLRFALCSGLGLFIATIGLKNLELIVIKNNSILTLGDLSNKSALVGIFGIFIMLAFEAFKIRGALILGIFVTSILGWSLGLAEAPKQIFSLPASIEPIAFKIDLASIFSVALIAPIISFLITDLFDSIGTLGGVGIKANLFQDTSGKDKQLEKTLQVDALATASGALAGLSTTTAFLESSSGVASGGRTGLVAVFVAILFLLSMFLMPIFQALPLQAIYPVLIVVGGLMFAEIRHINFTSLEISISAFFTIILMPLTTSITIGLASGFIAYVAISIFLRKWENLNLGILMLFAISLIPFIFTT